MILIINLLFIKHMVTQATQLNNVRLFRSFYKNQIFIIILTLIIQTQQLTNSCTFIAQPIQISNNVNAHTSIISGIKISSDQTFLVTSSGDGTIKIWNITEGILNYAYYFINSNIIDTTNSYLLYSGLDVSKSGKHMIVTGGSTGNTTIYNLSDFYHPTCITIPSNFSINFVAINTQNNRVITAGSNKSDQLNIMIYNLNNVSRNWNRNSDLYHSYFNFSDGFGGALSLDDSKLILLTNQGMNFMAWNPTTNLYQTTANDNQLAIRCIISLDSERIIYFNQNQKGFTVADYNKYLQRYIISQYIKNTTGIVRDLYLSPDKNRIIVVQADSSVNIYSYYNQQYQLTQILYITSGNQAYTINGDSSGIYHFIGDNYGSIYSLKCCPKLFQNVNNKCACKLGYNQDSNGNCICDKYMFDPTNDCITCISGFYLTNNICLNCSNYDSNCLHCGSLQCFNCSIQYYYDNTLKKCQPCSDPNCKICITVSFCNQCFQNYYYSQTTSTCIYQIACISSKNNICTNCNYLTLYIASTAICQFCNSIVGCITCSNLNYCYSCNKELHFQLFINRLTSTSSCVCMTGYYSSSPYVCTQCLQPHCLQCDSINCFNCINSFYKDSTNTHCCSSQNCQFCAVNNICTQCLTGLYVDSQYLCQDNSKIKNCTTYFTHGCQNCNPGFYLDLHNYCTVTSNCNLSLLSNQSCVFCIAGYFLDSNNLCQNNNLLLFCVSYGIYGCLECVNGTYLSSNHYCTTIYGCMNASLKAVCLNCLNNFYFDRDKIYCCSTDFCVSCNSFGICTKCADSYFLYVDNTCKNNSLLKNCININSTTGCTLCQNEFKLTQDGFCLNISNCNITNITTYGCKYCNINYFLNQNLICQLDGDILNCSKFGQFGCVLCLNGYYLVNNLCTSIPNCNLVNINTTDCLKCIPNYYFDIFNRYCCSVRKCSICQFNSICSQCQIPYYLTNYVCCLSPKCTNCNIDINICNSCMQGYFIDDNKYCCNVMNCKKCSQSIQGNCIQCIDSYFFYTDGLCYINNITNCSSYQQNGCSQCINNSYLSGDNLCTISLNCRNASITSNSTCIECISGYYLTNDVCCFSPNCTNCFSNINRCDGCMSGYLIDANSYCCKVSNCVKCSRDTDKCRQCIANFLLNIIDSLCYEISQIKQLKFNQNSSSFTFPLSKVTQINSNTQIKCSIIKNMSYNYLSVIDHTLSSVDKCIKIHVENPSESVHNAYFFIQINSDVTYKFLFHTNLLLSTIDYQKLTPNLSEYVILIVISIGLILLNSKFFRFSSSEIMHTTFILYLQRISMFRFSINFNSIDTFSFLYSLKASYLEFKEAFHISSLNYFEYYDGNYYLQTDSDLLRNASGPIIISILLFFIQVGIICYQKFKNQLNNSKIGCYVIKMCNYLNMIIMFPILYFSISTLIFYSKFKNQPCEIENQSAVGLSIFYIIYYVFLTIKSILQINWNRNIEQNKKIFIIQTISLLVFTVIDIVIILNSIGNSIFISIFVGIVLSSVVQFINLYQQKFPQGCRILLVVILILIILFQLSLTIVLTINPDLNSIIVLFTTLLFLEILFCIIMNCCRSKTNENNERQMQYIDRNQSSSNSSNSQRIGESSEQINGNNGCRLDN